MIKQEGDIVRLLPGFGVVVATFAVYGFAVIGFGGAGLVLLVLAVTTKPWWTALVGVAGLGVAVPTALWLAKVQPWHQAVETGPTTLRLTRGSKVLESIDRAAIGSTSFYFSSDTRTVRILAVYDKSGDSVARWKLQTSWGDKQLADFYHASGIPGPPEPPT